MGCAMGTVFALAYAKCEAKHMYPYIHRKALLFLRYIDDIFLIRNGTKEELISFIDELNKKHKTVKFGYKICTKQIEFLDPMVYRDQQNKIQTTIVLKPVDQQTCLHAQSNHTKCFYRQYCIQPSVMHKNKCVQLPLNSTETVTSLQKGSKKKSTRRVWQMNKYSRVRNKLHGDAH